MNDIKQFLNQNSSFRLDQRDLHFQLFNVLNVEQQIINTPAFSHLNKETCIQVIDLAIKFAREYLGRSYQLADKAGCNMLSPTEVTVPEVYQHVFAKFQELGLCGISAPMEYGGCGTPYVINQAIYSVLYGADPAFCIYPGFNIGAVYLLQKFGTEQQRQLYSQALTTPTMTAAMVMTESDAGSDVGLIRTKALREPDGRYRLEGSKIFISSGMHNLTNNIVYFVLARLDDAPLGTQGLSCFIVTKYALNADGSPGEYNHVSCDGVEKKMGLKGNATVQLSFGQTGSCYGTLLGEKENMGLSQLLLLMNLARVATGTYALGLATSAYYSAADYAQQRIQGTSIRAMSSPKAERLPIIAHLDVKRMLLDMRAKVDGMRALVLKAANYSSLAITLHDAEGDAKALKKKYETLADLLTPVVKAYCSDQAWTVCETAIQVHGGYGYISDFPVEQQCRDVKIMSIWEGTNYMQAADLVRSKLSLGKPSRAFGYFKEEIINFCEQKQQFPQLADQFEQLEAATTALSTALATFGDWLSGGEMEQIYLMSTRFMNAFGDLTVGWLLLENAVAAQKAIADSKRAFDLSFYQGKIYAVKYFYRNTLAHLGSKLRAIADIDETFKELNADHFPQF
ncbi:acyl-CoA dehydrogenase [Rheinheimera baltica]|uniref:acyl-CoA dehydrogenase n=1 Tax=Rheinheimera baltica TaxID=67576 RepID=UPI00040D9BD2|nr:acyl-CoA dehydrogenase [Rheinheimera baltica]